MYALVDDNEQVVETGALPEAWNRADGTSVSGYNTLSDVEVKKDGWLPLVENRPALAVGQVYGPPAYTVTPDLVTADYPAVPESADAAAHRTRVAAIRTLKAQINTAHNQLDVIIATQDPAAGVLTTATLSNYTRGLVDACQSLATILGGLMDRVVDMAEDVYSIDVD